ncbi:MAG TPA: rhomboid family intramembrane serine protease [Jatrophihabitantaceae bacterium]|nr:rhomboid family intramembrane serine protease [Jatrophihabitantaceae bacterium]
MTSRRLPVWMPRRRDGDSANEPPFDPTSWSGALVVMLFVGAALWAVQLVNAANDYSLNRFGLRPRRIDGLWGIVTEPFLHLSNSHLLSNTVPVVGVGWVLLLSGVRTWLTVSAVVIVLSGVATWLVAPSGLVVGAGGLALGWMGYLLARAYFSRRVRWIVVAVCVLFFFGTFFFTLVPSFNKDVSWQAQACGLGAGVVAGALLHPRNPRRHPKRRSPGPAVS